MASVIEPALARHGQLGFMADWASKLTGAVLRIAGLLHVADSVAEGYEPWHRSIDANVVNRARDVGSYLTFHAIAAIRVMGADPATSDAEYLLAWIRHKSLRSFTAREAHRSAQTRFKRAAELDSALLLLADRGYIRSRPRSDRRSGRPSEVYAVNPKTLEGGN
jgi:hypothetical protein